MKHIELTVLTRDVDQVIEYLGRRGIMHFSESPGNAGAGLAPPPPDRSLAGAGFGLRGGAPEPSLSEGRVFGGFPGRLDTPSVSVHGLNEAAYAHIRDNLEKLSSGASFLGLELPEEPGEDIRFPGETEEVLTDKLHAAVSALKDRENEAEQEKRRVEETLNEARAFANLNAPFADLDQLSYLALRVGHLDPHAQESIRQRLADRAVIIRLGDEGDRILAAASRKGRFALDSELKKAGFIPIVIPEDYQGIPAELLSGLEGRLKTAKAELDKIRKDKEALKGETAASFAGLTAGFLMAAATERLKSRLMATRSIYILSGWVPQDALLRLVEDLSKLTEGRIAVRSYSPEEMPGVVEGREKVPVSLKHGAFVKGFEGVVFSYGAPLYGTLDPTPLVAFFFTILFGIMFGDVGQGLVLLLAGIAVGRRGFKAAKGFRSYSTPLVAVGLSSMVMGFLNGEFFTNEEILRGPTRALLGLFMSDPPERILHLMPEKGNVEKLLYFFGFTIAVGVLLNSAGLVVNIINKCIARKYEAAFFAKTGLAGLLFFWYAVFIALRCLAGGSFAWFDFPGLIVPVLGIFFGPAIWRIISGERPILAEGFMPFVMEGFVEILETLSTYISNTVSFLRVGAFALSHAVLSFIVFTLSGMVGRAAAGPVFALVVIILGNALIIVLEGMIVAIQVVRLQYYEFFSKFFTETGVAFTPFRFRKEARG
ncbi:MAG: V-type ATP synthase subunit I [Treponema sp.]|jgi:V/A-type H+-transporting ATPase subunit I|nr:V-type ATP synthase subunit I [Treponema sp.]